MTHRCDGRNEKPMICGEGSGVTVELRPSQQSARDVAPDDVAPASAAPALPRPCAVPEPPRDRAGDRCPRSRGHAPSTASRCPPAAGRRGRGAGRRSPRTPGSCGHSPTTVARRQHRTARPRRPGAPRSEDPNPFVDRRVRVRELPEQMTADSEVEAAGREGKLLGVGLLEPDRGTARRRLAPCLGKHRGRESRPR
jgi:hypothetical protein